MMVPLRVAPVKSLPTRGAWIEIPKEGMLCKSGESLPTRGAWIEMFQPLALFAPWLVAPHTGSVD